MSHPYSTYPCELPAYILNKNMTLMFWFQQEVCWLNIHITRKTPAGFFQELDFCSFISQQSRLAFCLRI